MEDKLFSNEKNWEKDFHRFPVSVLTVMGNEIADYHYLLVDGSFNNTVSKRHHGLQFH